MEAKSITSCTSEPLHPAVPASAGANVIDTARAEVNAALLMTAMSQPSPDGIYAIGAVAVKVTNAIKAVAKMSWSSWGF